MKPILPSTVLGFLTSNTAFTPPTFQVFSLLQPGINTFLFIAKIPYLLFDLMLGLLLMHFTDEGEKSVMVYKFWLLNPISIFVSYVMGQFDIVPLFFMMLALYLFKKGKVWCAALSLGIASAFKMFSLLLLPFLILFFSKEGGNLTEKTKKVLLLCMVTLIPLILVLVALFFTPQYYESVNAAMPYGSEYNGFFGTTFYNRGEPGQPILRGLFVFFLDYSLNFRTQQFIPDTIYITLLLYALFLFGIACCKSLSFERVINVFLSFLLMYYAFAFFHAQWFLWAHPLLCLLILKEHDIFLKLYITLIPLFFIYTWYWDNAITTATLIPIIPKALLWSGPIAILNNFGLPAYQVINIFRSFLSAICILMSLFIIRLEFRKRICF